MFRIRPNTSSYASPVGCAVECPPDLSRRSSRRRAAISASFAARISRQFDGAPPLPDGDASASLNCLDPVLCLFPGCRLQLYGFSVVDGEPLAGLARLYQPYRDALEFGHLHRAPGQIKRGMMRRAVACLPFGRTGQTSCVSVRRCRCRPRARTTSLATRASRAYRATRRSPRAGYRHRRRRRRSRPLPSTSNKWEQKKVF